MKILPWILLLLTPWAAFAQPATPDRGGPEAVYDPAQDAYRYLRSDGKPAFPGTFDRAEGFQEGLGRVSDGEGGTRYLRPDGSQAFRTPLPFSLTAGFSQGLAWFVRDGRMGFFGPQGQEALPARFAPVPSTRDEGSSWEPSHFEGGQAVAGTPTRYGWITPEGTFLEASGYNQGFSGGAAFVLEGRGYRQVDLGGHPVGTRIWDSADRFSEGLAVVSEGGLHGWVNTRGEVVIPPRYDRAWAFSGGYAVFQKDGAQGLVDPTGKVVLPAQSWAILVPLTSPGDGAPLWGFRGQPNGPWGLVDAKGTVVVSPAWNDVSAFSEGLARVRVGGKVGFVDRRGTVAVKPSFDEAGDFHGGVAAVKVGDLWGFIDPRGRVALTPRWDRAQPFSGGLAPVALGDSWGLVDRMGNPVGDQDYQELGDLAEDRRPFRKGGRAGFLDGQGQVVLPAVWESVGPFQDGVAWVGDGGTGRLIRPDGTPFGPEGFVALSDQEAGLPFRVSQPAKFGVIDKTGRFVLAPRWDGVRLGSSGLTLVLQGPADGHDWSYVDAQGRRRVDLPGWHPYTRFKEDRAFVYREEGEDGEDGELALVDPQGKILARGFLDSDSGLVGGLASVQFADGSWGFINASGQKAFPPVWDDAFNFSGGLARVQKDEKWGYIDPKGKVVIPLRFDDAGDFHNGLAPVELDQETLWIDTRGKTVWP